MINVWCVNISAYAPTFGTPHIEKSCLLAVNVVREYLSGPNGDLRLVWYIMAVLHAIIHLIRENGYSIDYTHFAIQEYVQKLHDQTLSMAVACLSVFWPLL
jgi:hypothetical protein